MYQGSDTALKALGDSFFNLLMALEAEQIEFDLGCEDIMARHGAVEDGKLVIGERSYDQVIVPPLTENLDSPTWALLKKYAAAGGQVILCQPLGTSQIRQDGNPLAADSTPGGWRRIEAVALPGLLRTESANRGFAIHREKGGTLFHMRRQLADGELLFLVNTSIEAPSRGTLLTSKHGIEAWDLESGQTRSYHFRRTSAGQCEASFDLPPCGSLLLFLSEETRPSAPEHRPAWREIAPDRTVETRRVDPNVLVLDYVDVTAGGETRTNVYFYAANQFVFQKNGLERNPWDSAVQFKDEFIAKSFPAESGFEVAYRFKVQDRVPASLSIVLERADLYSITCNGQAVRPSPDAWWLDKSFARLEISQLAHVGENVVVLRAKPFSIYHEVEPAYILGDFILNSGGHGFVIAPSAGLQLGPWNEQGHPFYSGNVGYRQVFTLEQLPAGEFVVALNAWRGSVAKVLVNGRLAGYVGHAPWECSVTPLLRKGENTVEVVVVGTLKNTLGPHHGKPGLGTAWPGMFQRGPASGPPPGEDYHTVGYGLFQPFALKRTVSSAQ
jgi:hypothetical protein